MKIILLFTWTACVFSIFYFSWVPSPELGQTGMLPLWLAEWTDANENLRTAVPFLILGILSVLLQFKKTQVLRFGIIGAMVIESVQLLMPERSFDMADVAFAVIGLILGIVIGMLLDRNQHSLG
ncbi:MAG: hypothetical protein CFE21_21890 [Bacteroidetes bacterium B1(2017)]|nr:MAG: hypothetical protein CFE21_21890 [Bacteroidetes bacterium B1(2017)]